MHRARTDGDGIALRAPAVQMVTDGIPRVRLLPERVEGEVAGVLPAHRLIALPARRLIIPAEEQIPFAHGLCKDDCLLRGDGGGIFAVERAARELVADGVHRVAPLRIDADVRSIAGDALHRTARIVGREIPAFERLTVPFGNGQAERAALHREGMFGTFRKIPAVEPIVHGVLGGRKLRVAGDVPLHPAREVDALPRRGAPADEIIPVALRNVGGIPLLRGDFGGVAVHRDGEHLLRGAQKEDEERRKQEQRARPDRRPPERQLSAAAQRDGRRRRGGLLRLPAPEAGERHLEVPRKGAQTGDVGAGDAAFPAGDGVLRRVHRVRKLFLALPAQDALFGEQLSERLRTEAPRECLLPLGRAAQPFQRHAERLRERAELRDVRLGQPALPLGDRLRMQLEPLRKLRLREGACPA